MASPLLRAVPQPKVSLAGPLYPATKLLCLWVLWVVLSILRLVLHLLRLRLFCEAFHTICQLTASVCSLVSSQLRLKFPFASSIFQKKRSKRSCCAMKLMESDQSQRRDLDKPYAESASKY